MWTEGQGQSSAHKLKDSECNTEEGEVIWKPPSLHRPQRPLLFSPSLTLKHVYMLHGRKQTIKPSLLGNGSCVLHRRLTPRAVATETRHKRQRLCPCEWTESPKKKNNPTLWIEANQRRPGGLKADAESQSRGELRETEINPSQLSLWLVTSERVQTSQFHFSSLFFFQ